MTLDISGEPGLAPAHSKAGQQIERSGFDFMADAIERELRARPRPATAGKVQEVIGTLLKVSGLDATLGELCELHSPQGALSQRAEVVGFSRDITLLSPFGRLVNISRETRVTGLKRPLSIPIGDALLGRVIDSLGQPIDGKGELDCHEFQPVFADPPTPMSRPVIDQPMPTGVRVVDGLMTLAEGQRMGIFAPAGAGKSTLMGMFARGAQCDINVIALIGERGREVREFVEHILGPKGMARSVVVCATSDRSSIERAKAAYAATAVAEYFRDRGLRVLLMMDSLTRVARAQREIGLAMGEPPTRRGFPPSIFAELPRLLERAGLGVRGSITGLYTVLAEDESGGDPIAEEVRGILDGHMILSREIAAQNRYPAIDVLGSLSRVVPRDHVASAAHIRRLMAKHKEVELLLQVGEYQSGTDALADEAIRKIDVIRQFLGQETNQLVDAGTTVELLHQIAQG
jgi:type III secretion protein N (ATPase)